MSPFSVTRAEFSVGCGTLEGLEGLGVSPSPSLCPVVREQEDVLGHWLCISPVPAVGFLPLLCPAAKDVLTGTH